MNLSILHKPILALATSLVFAFFNVALSQDVDSRNPVLTSKLEVGYGTFFSSQTIQLQANASYLNDKIDFGKTFDLEKTHYRPNVSVMWRFLNRWRLYGEYFNFDRANERKLEEDIHWEVFTFEEGSYVKAGLKLDVLKVAVGYTVLDKHNQNLILGLGVHGLWVNPLLEGEATVDGETVHYKNKSTNTMATVPNVMAKYNYALSEKWSVAGKVDWLYLKVGDKSGGIWDVSPNITYQPIKNIGLSLNYRYFKVYEDVDKGHWDGEFLVEFKGPTLSINANF